MRLGADEARVRFASAPVARLGTADGQGRPHLVVVTDDWETLWWVRADGRAAIPAVTVERWSGWTGAPTPRAPAPGAPAHGAPAHEPPNETRGTGEPAS